MATTQKATRGTSRKSAADKANPVIVDEALKTLNKGEVPPEAPKAPEAEPPKRDEAKDDKQRFLAVSPGACLTAMQRAFGFGKAAINLECAVALTVFAFNDNKGANKEASEQLKQMYTDAGYDTATDGEDYKTIMRRIGAFGKLYASMDRREIIGAMDGKTENEALESLKNYLSTEYSFRGINSILAAAGHTVKQTNTPEYREGKKPDAKGDDSTPEPSKKEAKETAQEPQASAEDKATAAKLGERMEKRRDTDNRTDFHRRTTDQPNALVFRTEHLHVALPRDISRNEVIEMATKLMQFASVMNFEEEEKKQQSNPKQTSDADRRQHH
jgi:hypothetical protein